MQERKEITRVQKNHSPAFKAKVALVALSGEKTLPGSRSEFGVHQTQIHRWVKQIKESAARESERGLGSEERFHAERPGRAMRP